MQTFQPDRARAALAARLFSEINEAVVSFTALAEELGARTLSDLFYLQGALLIGGFIDAWPTSQVLRVIDTLPSAKVWRQFISIYDDAGDCVHACDAARPGWIPSTGTVERCKEPA